MPYMNVYDFPRFYRCLLEGACTNQVRGGPLACVTYSMPSMLLSTLRVQDPILNGYYYTWLYSNYASTASASVILLVAAPSRGQCLAQ